MAVLGHWLHHKWYAKHKQSGLFGLGYADAVFRVTGIFTKISIVFLAGTDAGNS